MIIFGQTLGPAQAMSAGAMRQTTGSLSMTGMGGVTQAVVTAADGQPWGGLAESQGSPAQLPTARPQSVELADAALALQMAIQHETVSHTCCA